MTIVDIEGWICSLSPSVSHATMGCIELTVNISKLVDKLELLPDKNSHSDKSTLNTCARRLLEIEEKEEDVELEEHCLKRWIFYQNFI